MMGVGVGIIKTHHRKKHRSEDKQQETGSGRRRKVTLSSIDYSLKRCLDCKTSNESYNQQVIKKPHMPKQITVENNG